MPTPHQLLERFAGIKLAVLGDVICDRFIYGDVQRISPEAPVPVMRAQQEELKAGGAANVAHNALTLGASVHLFGIVGEDSWGESLRKLLAGLGLHTEGVLPAAQRRTTLKTRLMAGSQHLLRVDEEVTESISAEMENALLASLRAAVPSCDALVLSDYDKGVLTPRLAVQATKLFRDAEKPVICDPKPANIPRFVGVSLLTPNRQEALLAAGINRVENEQTLEQAAAKLREQVSSEAVMITAGGDGIYLLAGDDFIHLPAVRAEVYDVVGAGDTVCATMALALAAGGRYEDGARLANLAAGIVVGKLGLATVSRDELADALTKLG